MKILSFLPQSKKVSPPPKSILPEIDKFLKSLKREEPPKTSDISYIDWERFYFLKPEDTPTNTCILINDFVAFSDWLTSIGDYSNLITAVDSDTQSLMTWSPSAKKAMLRWQIRNVFGALELKEGGANF